MNGIYPISIDSVQYLKETIGSVETIWIKVPIKTGSNAFPRSNSAFGYFRHRLQTQRLTEALRAGLSRVSDVEIALVADWVRDFGPEKAGVTLFLQFSDTFTHQAPVSHFSLASYLEKC